MKSPSNGLNDESTLYFSVVEKSIAMLRHWKKAQKAGNDFELRISFEAILWQ